MRDNAMPIGVWSPDGIRIASIRMLRYQSTSPDTTRLQEALDAAPESGGVVELSGSYDLTWSQPERPVWLYWN